MYVIINHSLSSSITGNVLFVVLSKGFGSIRQFLIVFFLVRFSYILRRNNNDMEASS